MGGKAKHGRLHSLTRLNIVSVMSEAHLMAVMRPRHINTDDPSPQIGTPREFTAPRGRQHSLYNRGGGPRRRDHCQEARSKQALTTCAESRHDEGAKMKSKAQAQARAQRNFHAVQQQEEQHEASLPANTALQACSSRSTPKYRPASLTLHSSFGFTALNTADLKQRICESRVHSSATLTQIPLDQRDPLPPTPTTPFAMGNNPSSISGSPTSDDRSVRSVVRRSTRQPMSRKSSYNLFKRVDSKSPLPREVATSVMSILHRDGHKKEDSHSTEYGALESMPTDPFYEQSDRYDTRYPEMAPKVHSASTMTITEDRARLPLSAATTIRDCGSTDQGATEDLQTDGSFEPKDSPSSLDDDALSPVSLIIPAPSPLPEDSPHKYGLRDKMDTPEVPKPTEHINVAKMRRKSSGLEMFNEAKTLQSAQSFLNGLSTARRRAESAAAVRTTANSDFTDAVEINALPRPSSTRPSRPSSIRHVSGKYDVEGRRHGHNFKSSGFAYSRPLALTQIKCYRGHNCLLPSSNRHAPVECAVCHIDDSAEHFSCSWCALRMCRYCRKDFTARGMRALKERIRKAELGSANDTASCSSEDLPAVQPLRTAKSTVFN